MDRCDSSFFAQFYTDSGCTMPASGAGATMSGPTNVCASSQQGSAVVICDTSAAAGVAASVGSILLGLAVNLTGLRNMF